MGHAATILIAEDERLTRMCFKEGLELAGHRVLEAETGEETIRRLRDGVDLVLLDYRLPDAPGTRVLDQIRKAEPGIAVVVMSAHVSVELAMDCLKRGAADCVKKPIGGDALNEMVERFLRRGPAPLAEAVTEAPIGPVGPRLIGDSPPMIAARQLLKKVAESPASTVLLTGESGTGKDVAAHIVHTMSERAREPFVNITCSSLPESLLESELFGHERGAFTDANRQRKGLFELADGGTVFLDEIGEMSLGLQAKLLRFLEEKAFRRVGGEADIKVDVRVIAATNRDLQQMVLAGQFREDLYYRLCVVPIELPPLRARGADVILLAEHFIREKGQRLGKRIRGLMPEAKDALIRHVWPGNVRELRNVVERAILLAEADQLGASDFAFIRGRPSQPPTGAGLHLPPEGVDFSEVEKRFVIEALERTNWNHVRAGRLLGMNRDQIRYRIQKFGLKSD